MNGNINVHTKEYYTHNGDIYTQNTYTHVFIAHSL